MQINEIPMQQSIPEPVVMLILEPEHQLHLQHDYNNIIILL